MLNLNSESDKGLASKIKKKSNDYYLKYIVSLFYKVKCIENEIARHLKNSSVLDKFLSYLSIILWYFICRGHGFYRL